jgi:hypothetical protein
MMMIPIVMIAAIAVASSSLLRRLSPRPNEPGFAFFLLGLPEDAGSSGGRRRNRQQEQGGPVRRDRQESSRKQRPPGASSKTINDDGWNAASTATKGMVERESQFLKLMS